VQKQELVKNAQNFFGQKIKQMCNDAVVTIGALTETTRDAGKEPLSWAFTANYGLQITSELAKKVVTWPPQAFFKNRSK
jgi:hypothetical protein